MAAARAGCYRASLSFSQGEIFLCGRSELKEEEKAGCSDCHPMSMHVSSRFKINMLWGDLLVSYTVLYTNQNM